MKKTIILIFLIFTDLISKYFIFNYVDLYQFIKITSFLEITHIHNFGVSFGLFSEIIPSFILVIIGSLVVCFVIYLLFNSKDYLEYLGLFIIICGAMANIIDRLVNGYVIDFIYFHINKFYWPAFNFADIYISIGIIMILMNMFKKNFINK
ncbi:signal peptidase II [Alphaproteobacteria bacterium]|nr:signal peptidase II [Alphaproteobacteria bacterium]